MTEPAIELDSTLEARISESVSRNLENQLEFIQALVRHPSVRGHDECVSIASIERVTKTIALYIAMWCGLEPVTPGS
jgi:hypothetical protein